MLQIHCPGAAAAIIGDFAILPHLYQKPMYRRRGYPCAVSNILLTGKAVILPVIALDELPDDSFPFYKFWSHSLLPFTFRSVLLHMTAQEYHRTHVPVNSCEEFYFKITLRKTGSSYATGLWVLWITYLNN